MFSVCNTISVAPDVSCNSGTIVLLLHLITVIYMTSSCIKILCLIIDIWWSKIRILLSPHLFWDVWSTHQYQHFHDSKNRRITNHDNLTLCSIVFAPTSINEWLFHPEAARSNTKQTFVEVVFVLLSLVIPEKGLFQHYLDWLEIIQE